jgi:alginate O-acetyltransferase complex protein AlgI
MLFSSIDFIYYFLTVLIVIYFVTPKKFKNLILLLASLLFYWYGEPFYTLIMIISALSAYTHGLLIQKYRKRIFLITGVTVNLSLLLFFKYTDFFITNVNNFLKADIKLLKLALPLGISFYTFQTVSYIIDVYRKDTKAQKNPIKLFLYVTFFPQLIAGPIVRYTDIERELDNRTHSFSLVSNGITRFVVGLSKKILIANVLGELCEIFRKSDEKSVLFYWLFAFSYMLQIYFDFSGYSDMAIGLGHMFGFNFPENFNYPFISRSITEFWRRWHMTLGTWFRDYVYIPMGGNRVSKVKWIRNIAIVWLLTGFWHGAGWNFILWGLYFAVMLVLEKLFISRLLDKLPGIVARIYVIILLAVSFVIFNGDTKDILIGDIKGLFGASQIPLYNTTTLYYLRSYLVLLVIAIIASTPIVKNLVYHLKDKNKPRYVINILEPVFVLLLMIAITAYLVDGSFNPFLYFRF